MVRPCALPGIRSFPIWKPREVTVVVFPDEDGGYTAVMPYFSCGLIASGTCLTAQGWTVDEALAEARILIEGYLDRAGAEGQLPPGARPPGGPGGAGVGGGCVGEGDTGC